MKASATIVEGARVALEPWRERRGTVEGLDAFYVRVVWDDGLGPYRVHPAALAPVGAPAAKDVHFVCAAPRGRGSR